MVSPLRDYNILNKGLYKGTVKKKKTLNAPYLEVLFLSNPADAVQELT